MCLGGFSSVLGWVQLCAWVGSVVCLGGFSSVLGWVQ